MRYRPRPIQAGDGKAHGSDYDWTAPQLGEALLHAPAGKDDLMKSQLEKRGTKVTPQSLDADLKALLQHVQDRMYWGFNEVWFSPQGYDTWPDSKEIQQGLEAAKKKKDGLEAKEASDDALTKCGDIMGFWNDPEEKWARAFAEMVVFSPYAGVGQTYYGTETKDAEIFNQFPQIFPIPMACQHLSTLCIRSRGFAMDQIGGAGCSCGATVAGFKSFDRGFQVNFQAETNASRPKEQQRGSLGIQVQYAGGATVKGDAPKLPLNTVEGLLEVKVTPGSVVAFNGGGPNFSRQNWPTGLTHIASVLRVHATRVQFLDTGVMVGNDPASRSSGGSAEGGTSDHSYRTGSIGSAAGDLVGVGVLKAPTKPIDKLASEAARSKPLALARLVILDSSSAGSPVVRFVSKMVHMRRPISYLIWSLRGLPVTNLSLIWYVFLPNGQDTDTLVSALSQSGWPTQTPEALFPKGTATPVGLWVVIRGNDQGGATVFRRKSYSHPRKDADGKNVVDDKGNVQWTTDAAWYQDLSSTSYPEKASERGSESFRGPAALGAKMLAPASGTLEAWCKTSFGKCYFQRASAADGSSAPQGSVEDFSSGVDFFDH